MPDSCEKECTVKKLKKHIGFFDLIMFNVVVIVGLRWVAVAAKIGPSSVLMWVGALLFFFIPSAFAVTELSEKLPSEGGLYVWAREAFGETHGFFCGFFYWVSGLLYYPNLLISISGFFIYIFGARLLHLEENNLYAVIFSLVTLWTIVYLNIRGVNAGKWLQNFGSIGTWIPAGLLLGLGVAAFFKSGPANSFTTESMIPHLGDLAMISIFANMCFSLAGMELQGCMAGEVKDAKKTIPKAIFISAIAIGLIYVLCTVALLFILPSKDVSQVTGVIQVISKSAEKFNIFWLAPIIALVMTLGGLGGCGAWLAGIARVPFVIGLDKYLPGFISKLHPKYGTPANSIITQGVISSLFLIIGGIGSNTKDAYMFLVDANIAISFIPYIYLFLSFIALKRSKEPGGFDYPWWIGLSGLLITIFALCLSLFIPPEGTADPQLFRIKVLSGVALFFVIAAVIFLSAKAKNSRSKLQQEEEDAEPDPV